MSAVDVALLTCAELLLSRPGDWYVEQVHREDGAVQAALEAEGLSVVRVDWADPAFDWSRVGAALFRSTWDYHPRFAEFSPWLDRVSAQTRLVNPAATVRWNVDKRYLLDLARDGVPVPATRLLRQGTRVELAELMDAEGWGEVVVKPVVSGAARDTHRIARVDACARQPLLDQSLQREAMLVQPFVPGVTAQGEVSVIVVGGEPTHAVRKVPKPGDFRVQDDHGGTVHAHVAARDELDFASEAVQRCGHEVSYARVDMARDARGALQLMELELVEPELFFRHGPHAAPALARAVARALGR